MVFRLRLPRWGTVVDSPSGLLCFIPFPERSTFPRRCPVQIRIGLGAVMFCSLLTSAAWGEPPRAIIHGPSGGTPGDILLLDASSSTAAEHFLWKVRPELVGRRTIYVTEAGRKCQVVSVPGTYTLTLAVSNDEGIDLADWVVTIPGNPGPQPPVPTPVPIPPGPVPPRPVPPGPPPPQPAPEFPDGQFKIAGDVYRWAVAVNSVSRAADARALAEAANSIASAIAAGTLTTPQKILAALLAANNAALGPRVGDWKPFGDQYSARLKQLYLAGRLPDNAAWAALLRETGAGLSAVRK